MNLTLFTNCYPYAPGEEFIETEIQFLASSFDLVTLVPLTTTDKPRETPDNVVVDDSLAEFLLNNPGFKNAVPLVFETKFWKSVCHLSFAQKFDLKILSKLFRHWVIASLILRWMQGSSELFQDSDIFYTYWFNSQTTALALYCEAEGDIPFLTRAHGADLYSHRVHKGYFPFREFVLSKIQSVHPCSEHGRQHLLDGFSKWSQKIQVARLGVNEFGENPWEPSGNLIRICSCAYLTAVKRIDVLADALMLIVKNNPTKKVEWTHFGGGPLLDQLKHQISGAPERLSCDFRGNTPNRTILECYGMQGFDALVNCSSSEGLPVSIMEAFSFGIPAIAPNVGGISEIVEQNNGCLMSAECNPQEVADAIMSIASQGIQVRNAAREIWKNKVCAEVNYGRFINKLQETANRF